jgi:hypothetical protein
MSKSFLYAIIFGALAAVAVRFSTGLTPDGECVTTYLAMILGTLLAIGKTLEQRS